jgi:hypothetical protein
MTANAMFEQYGFTFLIQPDFVGVPLEMAEQKNVGESERGAEGLPSRMRLPV